MALETIAPPSGLPNPDGPDEVPADVPRHGGTGQPWIRHPDLEYVPELDDGDAKARRGRGAYHSRASSWGKPLANHFLLHRWELRSVVYGMSRSDSLVMAAQAVESMDERTALQEIEQLARVAAGADEAARKGTAFHKLSERKDRGEDLSYLPARVLQALDAWIEVTSELGRIVGMEQFVVWDEYQVSGRYDRLYELVKAITIRDRKGHVLDVLAPGTRVIADLKSGTTARYFDCCYGMQQLPYSHGTPYSHERGRLEWPDGIAPSRRWAVIPHVSHADDGASAELLWVDLDFYHRLIPDLQRIQEVQRIAGQGFLPHTYDDGVKVLNLTPELDPRDPRAHTTELQPVTREAGVPRQVIKVGIMAALVEATSKDEMVKVWENYREHWDADCERMAAARAREFDLAVQP